MAHKVRIHALMKDSVPYDQTIEIPDEVYNVLKELKDSKSDNEQLFDASSGTVTKFLKECMPELSPKLFRTALGTKILCEELRKVDWDPNWSQARKLQEFDNANLAVAKKLNHQHDIAKNYSEQTAKLDEKVIKANDTLKQRKLKAAERMLKLNADESKAKANLKGKDLKDKLAEIDEKRQKVQESIKRASDRIEAAEINREMKEKTKNYSLGTSKTAYSSPKITVSFCKSMDVDLSKIYSKSLQEKFAWAMNVDPNYWKNYPNVK